MSSRYFPFALLGLACLACSKTPEPTPAQVANSHAAEFSYTGTLKAQQPITFTPTWPTPGNTHEYTWNFGDGTAPVTGRSIVHTFPTSGTFPVKLMAFTDNGYLVGTQQVPILAAPPDTLAVVFTSLIGEYRFTKVTDRVTYTGSPSPPPTVSACDVLGSASRNGAYSNVLTLSLNGTYPVTVYGALTKWPPAVPYYLFYHAEIRSNYSISFKAGTDSITCNFYSFSPGGSSSTTYYGKKR